MNAHPRRSWSFATPTSQALQYYAVFLVLLAICAALSLLSSVFTTIDNLGNVSEQVSVVASPIFPQNRASIQQPPIGRGLLMMPWAAVETQGSRQSSPICNSHIKAEKHNVINMIAL